MFGGKSWRSLSLIVLLTLAPGGRLAAQIGAGAVAGRVTDPDGSPVPGAVLTATNIDTERTWTTVSGADANTPAFLAPNTVAGSAAFGTITAAGDPRVVQLQ